VSRPSHSIPRPSAVSGMLSLFPAHLPFLSVTSSREVGENDGNDFNASKKKKKKKVLTFFFQVFVQIFQDSFRPKTNCHLFVTGGPIL
jgi:hypothetical protein